MTKNNNKNADSGFNRLKQAVVAGAMGVGLAGVGFATSPVVNGNSIPRSVSHASGSKNTRSSRWYSINNNALGIGSTTTTSGGRIFGGAKNSTLAYGILDARRQSGSISSWDGGKSSTINTPSNSNFYIWHASGAKTSGVSFKNTTGSSSTSKWGTWFSVESPSPATFGPCPATNPNTQVSGVTLAGGFRDGEISTMTKFWFNAGSGLTGVESARDCYITQSISQSGYWNSQKAGTYWSNAFNNVLWMAVDGAFFVNPDSTIDVSGDTLTTDSSPAIVAGIDAQIEYFFHPENHAVRARYLLSNTTSAPISVELLVGGTLAGAPVTVHQTDDGDQTVDSEDKWLTAEGEGEGGGLSDSIELQSLSIGKKLSARGVSDNTFSVGISRYGEGASVIPEAAIPLSSNGVFANRYDVTVPVGRTIGVMVFVELFRSESDANAKAGVFNDWSSIAAAGGYLDGIGDAEIDQLVNYAPRVDTDSDGLGNTVDEDDDGDGTLDTLDAFPLDPAEDTDTDDDGVGDNADADDDGDGCSDAAESGLTDPLDAASTPPDSDTDGICDPSDDDDDGDGTTDELDAFPLDPSEDTDTDEDGIGNNADTDDDDDGVLDLEEELCLSDPLDAFSLPLDADGDGVCDALEEANVEVLVESNDEDFMGDLLALFGGVNPFNLIFISGVWLGSRFRKKS